MTEYHVAIDRLASPDPDTPEQQVETTYLGVVDQAHVDEVRAIAGLEDTPRFVKEHPHIEGAFMVLRDDGDLDVYVPVGATEYRVYEPDPGPKGELEGVDLPRGATAGPAYIEGAVRFGDQSIGGAVDHLESGPRYTWPTTESPAGASCFNSVALYLIRVASEPQVIYDPVSDKLGQFGPLNLSGRALKNDGARRTNREGRVNIQVEVLGKAASPWTKGFDPADKPNFRKLLAAGRAWGVPDVWPAGKPPAYPSGKPARSRTIWQSKAGHYAHAQVPGNDHGDPGAIDITIVPGKPSGGDTPTQPATPSKPVDKDAFPGALKFGPGANNSYVTRLGQMLVKRGAQRFYAVGPGPKWGTADKDATRAFQQAQGWTGTDADGIPGATTWKLLVEGKGKDIPALPKYEPYPGADFFHAGRYSPLITALGRRLVAQGCGAYTQGPGPNWTNADRESVRRFQKKTGVKQTGIPTKETWDALKIPNL